MEYFIDKIGHDGTGTITSPHFQGTVTRGFHIQELIGPLVLGGMAVTPIELGPVSILFRSLGGDLETPILFPDEQGNWDRFNKHVKKTRNGVLTGECGDVGHAVAVDGIEGRVYDPDGEVFDYSVENLLVRGFKPMCLWKLQNV